MLHKFIIDILVNIIRYFSFPENYKFLAFFTVTMVTEYSIVVRNRAIGMILAGMSQTKVSHALKINLRTIQRWWALSRGGKSLNNKPGRCRKNSLSKAAKIIIAKSLSKPHKSTRILTQDLRRRGIVTVSHVTVLN